MEKKMEYLFYLTRCGVQNEGAKAAPEELDWKELLSEASRLKLDPFVKYAIKNSRNCGCPEELWQSAVDEMRRKAIGRVMAAEKLSALQQELAALGIPSAVLKGQAASSAYPVPELRSGCDIDLYVEEKHEAEVYRWVAAQGHKVCKRNKGFLHGEITHQELGLIELHVSLCNSDEGVVKGILGEEYVLTTPKEPFETVTVCGSPIVTLGMTEHMLFLVHHMINHYLHAEATPRMILDINAFFCAYRDRIDVAYFWKAMEALKYDKFVRTVFGIGVTYFGFSEVLEMDANKKPEEMEALLLDFCENTENRGEVMSIYDTYCQHLIPSGVKAVGYKLKLVGKNFITAIHLRHQMSFKTILSLGIGRIRRILFSRNDKLVQTAAKDKVVKQRLDVMERMNMM